MAVIFNWWLLDVVALLSTILAGFYLYFTVVFSYWEKRGVKYMKPTIPFGNFSEVFLKGKHVGLHIADYYKKYQGEKYVGFFQFNQPSLIIRDLDMIKTLLLKEFPSFHDRGFYFDEENDPLAANLFLQGGQAWKNMRTKLTPTFTSGKMKMMFQKVLECGRELAEAVRGQAERGESVEVKDLVARYSTDVIASCAFGIQCNCLQDPEAEFRRAGKEFFQRDFLQAFANSVGVFAPTIAAFLKIRRVPRKISNFFRRIVRETVEYREQNNVTGNDFMQLLIQLKNKGFVDVDSGTRTNEAKIDAESTKKLTMDEVAAQAFIFFLAGFETSSTTVSFCLYELATNTGIQTRLRKEIHSVLNKHGGSLTYEAVMDMEYLTMVIDETLRKYPPVPILNRKCNRKCTLPETGLVVEPGTHIIVPVFGLHYDPEFYPDPHKFDPERFSPENKAGRNNFCYLPFGEGPRICIGMRFGYMQTKVALISLLSKYEFNLSEKTVTPLKFSEKILILTSKDGIYLQMKQIS